MREHSSYMSTIRIEILCVHTKMCPTQLQKSGGGAKRIDDFGDDLLNVYSCLGILHELNDDLGEPMSNGDQELSTVESLVQRIRDIDARAGNAQGTVQSW